jgi:hypothetical protein
MMDPRKIALHTTTPAKVEKIMLDVMMLDKRNITSSEKITHHCRNAFGFESHIVCLVWNLILNEGSVDVTVYSVLHLLWMLAYFKGYSEEEEYICKFKCCGNIFREKVWYLADCVASIQIVSILKIRKNVFLFIYI